MTGCVYIVRKETSKKGSLSCGAIQDGRSMYCPKHKVMFDGQDDDNKRRMAKVRAAKDRKKIMRDMLPTSPLRAYNPTFDEGRKREGYSQ